MSVVHTSSNDVLKIWEWCSIAWARCGHRLKFPANTDPQKTYQWRFAKRLCEKFAEWGFDDITSQAYIHSAAEYIKERKLLRKGLTVFFQSNLADICYQRLYKARSTTTDRLEALSESKRFVDARTITTTIGTLLSRSSLDAYANIVEWYQSNNITQLYIALSKSSTVALHRLTSLHPAQRVLLPSAAELYGVRASALENIELRNQAEEILDVDWRRV